MRALFALILAAAAALPAQACTHPIRAAVGPFPPYIYQDDKGQWTGTDIRMVQAIMREAGCTLEFAPEMPAARYFALFQLGQIDVIMGASDTPERRRMARFSRPYRDETVLLFALDRTGSNYDDINNFTLLRERHLKLLAPKVGWYGEAYAKALPILKTGGAVSEYVNPEQGVRMLAAGRAQLILGVSDPVRFAAANQHVNLRVLPWVVASAPVHLMLNSATVPPADVDAIDAAILKLQRSGALAVPQN